MLRGEISGVLKSIGVSVSDAYLQTICRKMNELKLQGAFEISARFFRREIITEPEFAQKVMGDAISYSDELGDVIPDFSKFELGVIGSFVSAHSNEESLRMFACAYIVDFNEEGIVERRMEEIRPKFEQVIDYFKRLER